MEIAINIIIISFLLFGIIENSEGQKFKIWQTALLFIIQVVA